VWIEFVVHCGYMPKPDARELYASYDTILRRLIGMINHPES
jgi:hypothetical protein